MTRWIDLEGTANTRDVGGLPGPDGTYVRPGRLLRSDNLQDLTDEDVAHLVEDVGIRAVADLRTGVEVTREGPHLLHDDDRVEIVHLSVYPEDGDTTDVLVGVDDPPPLPWLSWPRRLPDDDVYVRYLEDRPESVLAALRLIAAKPTIVHCAAGKDRTGVVVALALTEVGIAREHVLADYEATAERIEPLLARLVASPTYHEDSVGKAPSDQAPRAERLARFFEILEQRHGSAEAWLRAHGWTEDDAGALRAALLAE